MHIFEWLVATNPGMKGINRTEKAKLVKLRERVCSKANTNIHILINAKCRGAIGKDLISRMSKATEKEIIKILEKDHG